MYTNILSRSLEKECLNFGFSGNAFGEEIVARRLAEVENPGAYILDYETNALDKGTLESSLPEFIGILRRAHPETPFWLFREQSSLRIFGIRIFAADENGQSNLRKI